MVTTRARALPNVVMVVVALLMVAGTASCSARAVQSPSPPNRLTTPSAAAPTAQSEQGVPQVPLGTPTGPSPSGIPAATALDALTVRGRAPLTGYDRARFGAAWLDADRNGCDTRNDVLSLLLTAVTYKSGTRSCVVLEGDLEDPYTGADIHFVRGPGALVDIDHVVSLADVWVTGGSAWDVNQRAAVANDPMNLLAVDASANRQKGDGDAATWLPPAHGYRCAYVARQIGVKVKYGLWVTPAEKTAMGRVLATCRGQMVPGDSGAPVRVAQKITDPGPRTQLEPETTRRSRHEGSNSYRDCAAARAAGAAPVHRGDPGYGPHLDGDGDGTACE